MTEEFKQGAALPPTRPQFNEDLIARNDLPRDAFELIHDLAYDHEGRERFQYRTRAQKILMAVADPVRRDRVPEPTVTQTEGDSWPTSCPMCNSTDKQDRNVVYRGWGDPTYMRNYFACYHPWHFDKWQTGRIALMEAGARVPEDGPQPTARSDKDYAIEHAGYLADAVDHYLEERNKFDVLEVVDVGEQDSLNDHIRALRDCTYEFRKRRARALGATSISKDAEKESARDKFQELRPGLNPDTDPDVARYYRGFELGWVSRALAAAPVSPEDKNGTS